AKLQFIVDAKALKIFAVIEQSFGHRAGGCLDNASDFDALSFVIERRQDTGGAHRHGSKGRSIGPGAEGNRIEIYESDGAPIFAIASFVDALKRCFRQPSDNCGNLRLSSDERANIKRGKDGGAEGQA